MDSSNKAADKAEEVLKAYLRLFDTSDGMIVLNDLIKRCNFFHSSIATDKNGSEQPHMTFFYEGQRDVVCRILSTLEKTPEYIRELYTQQHGGITHAHATYTAGEPDDEKGREQ